MSQAAALRSRAEALTGALPALMAEAEHLAATVMLGAHGRRRSGMGDEFWQYRAAAPGDAARQIDWRRSARSDAHFVQEKEWQAAQTVTIWFDNAKSMEFSSDKNLPTKADRGRLLALAVAVLLIRGGERVALATPGARHRGGEAQLMRIAQALSTSQDAPDYGEPELGQTQPHARALLISDYLGDIDAVSRQLAKAADRGIKGAILQVLDPQEEAFPFRGRTIFESVGRTVRHETLKASDLRSRYLQRLAARKGALADLARRTGWQYHCHHTHDPAQVALLWIYSALEHRR
jgi:uncharacterized protein (DUF58 family)